MTFALKFSNAILILKKDKKYNLIQRRGNVQKDGWGPVVIWWA